MAQQLDDLSRSLTPLEQDSTIIAVIEMSQASWLVAGIVPGIERHPLKKLEPSEVELLRLLMRWRAEATEKGRTITRIAVAFEAGRDGFWLARWLRARDIEAYVIHPTSVAVSREHRRAKTDRLDTGLLKRVFIGWLRGAIRLCWLKLSVFAPRRGYSPPEVGNLLARKRMSFFPHDDHHIERFALVVHRDGKERAVPGKVLGRRLIGRMADFEVIDHHGLVAIDQLGQEPPAEQWEPVLLLPGIDVCLARWCCG